jgi:hypothetical protein
VILCDRSHRHQNHHCHDCQSHHHRRLEARNALAEARRQLLSDTTANLFEKNQFKRCRVFKGDDREACEARVRDEGSSTGSVQSGGILREVVRPVPATPAK